MLAKYLVGQVLDGAPRGGRSRLRMIEIEVEENSDSRRSVARSWGERLRGATRAQRIDILALQSPLEQCSGDERAVAPRGREKLEVRAAANPTPGQKIERGWLRRNAAISAGRYRASADTREVEHDHPSDPAMPLAPPARAANPNGATGKHDRDAVPQVEAEHTRFPPTVAAIEPSTSKEGGSRAQRPPAWLRGRECSSPTRASRHRLDEEAWNDRRQLFEQRPLGRQPAKRVEIGRIDLAEAKVFVVGAGESHRVAWHGDERARDWAVLRAIAGARVNGESASEVNDADHAHAAPSRSNFTGMELMRVARIR